MARTVSVRRGRRGVSLRIDGTHASLYRPGETVYVRTVVLDTGEGSAVASWLIERDQNDRFRLLRGTVTETDETCDDR